MTRRITALGVRRVNMTIDEMVKAVQAHARDHYEEKGWDYAVECFSAAEIKEMIDGADTLAQAISKVQEVCETLDDRRGDIQATAW
jgi:hypothetical protein